MCFGFYLEEGRKHIEVVWIYSNDGGNIRTTRLPGLESSATCLDMWIVSKLFEGTAVIELLIKYAKAVTCKISTTLPKAV